MKKQLSNIRNFCIISHIDAGKSTLADRFLELTGTIEKRKMRAQFLDMMDLEREKGITIKLQPVRMEYRNCLLNLIDTPGHVDFSYEVSRSLAAVEGAVLLVDASQGIQAQTLANLHLAQEQNLAIIPVVNKIDLAQARTEETIKEISQLLNVNQDEVIKISAKEGTNVEKVLEAVIKKIPSPGGKLESPLRALIFDSNYDPYQGVIAYLKIVDGQVRKGQQITMLASGASTEVKEVGVFKPQLTKLDLLEAGQIGYLITGLKDVGQCRVGDTITISQSPERIKSLAGYQDAKPMVFASFYPTEADNYELLKDGLAKLKLNDASLQYEPESAQGLGRGFRCGFLGTLHLEIVSERLKREYKLELVVSSPTVSYQLITKPPEKEIIISSPADLPEINRIKEIKEPWLDLEIVTPHQYLGTVMKLLSQTRSQYQESQYLTPERVLVRYRAPLNEIVIDFYDKLKNATAGYASMSYQLKDYQPADLVRLDILVAGRKMEAFSRIVHRERAYQEGKAIIGRLKEVIPSQLFAVSLQAAVSGRIIARENIRAWRKDVTGYLYGGDYSRKRKLLEKQKKGKKKMKQFGQVNSPQEAFLKVLRK
jgi:GTP-binding protein LepA